jgi:SsrA-binding protein
MSDDRRVLATNRKARHVYHVLEKEIAGIELLGTEVKAIRDGKINLKEAYVLFAKGEAFLVGCHVGAYEAAGYAHHDPIRRRRLLLHKREIERLSSKVQEKGLTVVPLGKQLHDKRETLRQRTLDREAEQAIKDRGR